MSGKTYRKFHLIWEHEARTAFRFMIHKVAMDALLKHGYEAVRVTLCGAACKLAAEIEDVREGLREMRAAGIELRASEADVERHKVRGRIEELGIAILPMPGHWSSYKPEPDEKVMTF